MRNRIVSTLKEHPWVGSLAGVLVLATVLTAAVRLVAVRAVDTNLDARQQEIVTSTLNTLERRFDELRETVSDRAARLAVDPAVVKGLRHWRNRGRVSGALVDDVSRSSLSSHTTTEVYSPDLRAVAWNGVEMPLDSTRLQGRSPQQPLTTVVTDEDGRRAIAHWHPVVDSGRIRGAVRVARVIHYRPPVQNRYVQALSLEGKWAQETGELVRIRWGATPPKRPHRALRGVGGNVLGYVTVDAPPPGRIVERTASFYADLLAVWVVLLLGLGLAVAVAWYLRLARRRGLRRHAGARSAAARRLATVVALAIGVRYALLLLDVPGRWALPGSVLAPLFDPVHFASAIGGGLFRSIGDLLLTGVWAAGIGAALAHLGSRYRPRVASVGELWQVFRDRAPRAPNAAWYIGTIVVLVGASVSGLVAIAYVVRRAVLDSTLDFFSRTGLLPEPLVLGVLCGLVLLLSAGLLAGLGALWMGTRYLLDHRPARWASGTGPIVGVVLFAVTLGVLYLTTDVATLVSFPYTIVALAALALGGLYGVVREPTSDTVLTLRGLLTAVFAATLLLYPLLYAGMDAKRKEHMVDAARSFERGQDPRVLYSIREVLRSASNTLFPLLGAQDVIERARIDSVATGLVRESLLASLSTYDVHLSVLGAEGTVLGQYSASGEIKRASSIRAAQSAFAALRPDSGGTPSPVIEQLSENGGVQTTQRGQYEYAGLVGRPVGKDSSNVWVLVRIEPHSVLPGTGFGVPTVLLPDGSFGGLYANLSLAVFRGGQLVRSFGEDFGRTRLRSVDQVALETGTTKWREEEVRNRRYLTYYHSFVPSNGAPESVVAVRIPAILGFDHLYYLLRLTVAGLCVGFLVYLLGLYVRFRQGRLPAERVRFRNKVLNAFLVVGIVSMGAVGVVGVRLVTGENDRVVEHRIQDDLNRVEEMLALEARPGERLSGVAERMDVGSLAAQVGLDLHFYRGATISRTSQPRLLRDGLVAERLPGDVYHALYNESYRFVIDRAAIGQFSYRVGYRALLDEEGRPQLVVAVPTLARQEQLQEEQSRTLAYLFGALLLLVVVVVLTGVVLANALAQPIAQLRKGLEAVGRGQFARTLSVDTRDEIGDLVQTFNEMRDQLAESRRKLARQERELAWREMARQVAHEIKNPLTPMKLSIQHLRRAFQRTDEAERSPQFAELFDRITSTLISQIDSLVRIADEFSTFARLPTQVPEPIDVNEVIREAGALMEQETSAAGAIELDLGERPLVVEADREELRRIYINLLKNALQAIPDDRDGCVRVRTERVQEEDGPVVESRVTDNGTGIPAEQRDKIFEPNFSTKTSGTGLGLAIAKKAIEELGGDIGFETTEGEGTTFRIRLPLVEEGVVAG